MENLIKKLVESYGPTGSEGQVRDLIKEEVKSFVDETYVDTLGNLVAYKKGNGKGKKILIAAHMDEIGVAVKFVDDQGFARFAPIGGILPVGLIGSRVRFANGTIGVIFANEREIDKLINEKKIPELDTMYIDPGIPANKEISLNLGDCAVFERPMVKQGKKIIAKALDNRIGCAVAIETLKQLKTTPNDVYFLFTVQEEEGLAGAATGTYNINPDIAIAIDVTVTGDSPEGWYSPVKLEGGPVITLIDKGIFVHPAVKEGLIQAAEKINIPYQFEVLDSGATDAAAMQLARQGVLAGNICIPCRYIHSPSEMVDLDDVENTIKLLHQYLQT